MSFDTTKTSLKDLLSDIHVGKLQLPEFQRDYVWNEGDVCSLLESIAKGFPVGALLTLERGGSVEFKPRGIEGTSVEHVAPEHLLLDGQQRMTSLYKTIYSKEPARVRTAKGQVVERFFYLSIEAALEPMADIEAAIELVPPDRIRRTNFGKDIDLDLSTAQREYDRMLFPLNQTLDPLGWILGCIGHWNAKGEQRMDEIQRFQNEVLNRIQAYAMPVIKLSKDNSREAVCTVFEKVNVGGKKLDAFELVTAIYAASGFDLREDWAGTQKKHGRLGRLRDKVPPKGVFADLASTDFLQACTVLHTRDLRQQAVASGATGKEIPPITCTREALLGLPLDAYRKHADAVEAGFIEVAKFLNEQKILWGRDVPYPPQMVALATIFALLPPHLRNAAATDRLSQWYWSGVLGEFYGSATETKIARDVPDLLAWLEGGPAPRTIADSSFQAARLDTLRSRLSAAYKGFHALLMRSGCRDFITGKGVETMTVFSDALDIHHIFPRAWCEKQGIPPQRYNSIINKTALSKGTNIAIGGSAPSQYLARIEERHGLSTEALDQILRSHLIEPALLRADDFEGFWKARKLALAELAAGAQGKPVQVDEQEPAEGYADDDGLTLDEEEMIEEVA
ncbi:GmrSD restriction endonuclease domain-containing protein [Sphingomonas sanguinis]|jgi:hypothetical protein|uniref:DUF262 domain-containing protein n=1 Tax=Sphingomonas sanguinis TaxID=33051 RepID=A0A7Y7QWR9_9SPHN|nr:DUF262 domain-containing protein [Sphingomonas sanguinis]MBZ6382835.1 DUF262 domain-containing protein [Sphingomonas sanguinis]NNG51582.1 DUF262 domain-containing protein [Sphingomonas sanguinis]NNG52389.1 DUF262 domain-containing protein [Sphingomonas sanguinis]NVP32135.1 DUF262 domain-containing protein [Sphingomonas sanguinis]